MWLNNPAYTKRRYAWQVLKSLLFPIISKHYPMVSFLPTDLATRVLRLTPCLLVFSPHLHIRFHLPIRPTWPSVLYCLEFPSSAGLVILRSPNTPRMGYNLSTCSFKHAELICLARLWSFCACSISRMLVLLGMLILDTTLSHLY